MPGGDLLSVAGWYFLPGLVTNYLQPTLYTVFIRAGEPKPQPGTQRFVRDRRRIQIFVIAAYLLYTIYEADYQLRRAGDFYQDLGVRHDVDDRGLQSRFRRLTVQYHPDKVSSAAEKAHVEEIYVHLKLARDTLIDPAKRFAYDRFGTDILQWQHCKTTADFVLAGTRHIGAYYVVSGAFLVLIGVLGYLQSGKFWRYLVMAGLFVIEMHVMTRPTFPAVLTRVVNPILISTKLRVPYLPFQMLALLRKVAITFFIALSQLGPLLQQDPMKALGMAAGADAGDKVPDQLLARLDALGQQADAEVSRMLALELAPFAGEPAVMGELRASTKEWLVQNTVRNDPEVRRAITAVLGRRQQSVQRSGQHRVNPAAA